MAHSESPPEDGYIRKSPYHNPPDPVNPDALTLREQWQYATKRFSKYYGQAWGSAILAGGVLFALGWYIKGGNPLASAPKPEEQDHEQDSKQPVEKRL